MSFVTELDDLAMWEQYCHQRVINQHFATLGWSAFTYELFTMCAKSIANWHRNEPSSLQ